jgi:UDP-N-acetyl-D-galactosamine dehydrogenase
MNYLNKKIVVVGLGYVGLPLAVRLSTHFDVIGYDISLSRISELRQYSDKTNEVSKKELKQAKKLSFTNESHDIKNQYIYIVTVPTPVNKMNLPDLSILKAACKVVGKSIKNESIIIFESTVYPGVTEKICAPIISKESKLAYNKNFYIGYSPERINPGDKKHKVEDIVKVVSGSTDKITKIIGKIYKTIIKAGVFYAKSIEVAETAKAIENAQRDINIAFINEISLLCGKLNISIYDVLEAAKTKWNFLDFHPGLVGGHCIGVDPYYLAHVAKKVKANAEVILAGRRINDKMANIIFKKIVKLITLKSRVLQIGISFKENVPDIRNSKAAELAAMFINKKYNIDIYDPVVDKDDVLSAYNISLADPSGKYDCIVITVPHKIIFKDKNFKQFLNKSSIIFDITGNYRSYFTKDKYNYFSL